MVIGPNLNLFLTARNVYWAEESIFRLPTAIFLKSLFYAASLESHPLTQQREQGLPQESISLLTEHILEALFRGLKTFILLHPSNLGW